MSGSSTPHVRMQGPRRSGWPRGLGEVGPRSKKRGWRYEILSNQARGLKSQPELSRSHLGTQSDPCQQEQLQWLQQDLHQVLPLKGPLEDPHWGEALCLQLEGLWLEICKI